MTALVTPVTEPVTVTRCNSQNLPCAHDHAREFLPLLVFRTPLSVGWVWDPSGDHNPTSEPGVRYRALTALRGPTDCLKTRVGNRIIDFVEQRT